MLIPKWSVLAKKNFLNYKLYYKINFIIFAHTNQYQYIMSEQIENVKQLPHQLLLTRHSINPSDLNSEAKEMLKLFKQTMTAVNTNSKKNGEVRISDAVRNKITAYDRYICDGIFEYLEKETEVSNAQIDSEEENADTHRDKVEEKIEETEEKLEEVNSEEEEPPNSADGEEQKETPSDDNAKIGFWDWQ
jgi:hypothetical protein